MNHQENQLAASDVPTERELAYRRRRAARSQARFQGRLDELGAPAPPRRSPAMATARTPRFQRGDLVNYIGTQWRRHGIKRVIGVQIVHGEPLYSLHDEIWGGTLHLVRESSLRGPEDD